MEILINYPAIKEQLESLCRSRRNEILSELLEGDSEYKRLCIERANASMILRKSLDDKMAKLFEVYSDCLYAQDVFELDLIYRQAIFDTLKILAENNLI
jgi:hypothetical protein